MIKLSSILVVEDESIVRMDIAEMLREAGYDVVGEVGNGEKAIEMTDKYKPDLIIMDIKMPKMNGLKASKIIGKKYDVPILILTAYSHKEFIEDAKQKNIVGYLVKPVSEFQLIPAVEIALEQSTKMLKLQSKVDESQRRLKERKLIEKAKGILMKQLNITEEAAYQRLRKHSMDNHITIVDEAVNIIGKFG